MNDADLPTNPSQRPINEAPDEARPASAAPTEAQIEQELPTVARLDQSPGMHDPYAAFRLNVFRHFLLSFLLATVGTQIMSVALQWEIAQRTKDDYRMAGLLGGLQALPVILLALPAGHVSDTFSRKRVLMCTQAILAICPCVLAALVYSASGWKHYIAAIFTVVFINAIALTFGRPARQSYLPQLVSKKVFSNAVTWNATFFELASVTGPAIGGLVIARWSTVAALLCSSICTVICLILTALLPAIPPPTEKEPLNFQTLVAGVRFVFRHEFLLPALTLDLFAVLFGGATYMLPYFAQKLPLGGGLAAFGFGLLRAAPSVGAVAMAILIAHLPPMRRAGYSLMLAVIGFGAATIVFGLSKNFWLSMAMLVLIGAFDNVSVVIRHTLVQMMTPDSMRGRVSAVNQVFIGSSNEIGGLESGLTAQWFGLVRSVVLGGICTIAVVSLIAVRWPKLRKLGALHDISQKTA